MPGHRNSRAPDLSSVWVMISLLWVEFRDEASGSVVAATIDNAGRAGRFAGPVETGHPMCHSLTFWLSNQRISGWAGHHREGAWLRGDPDRDHGESPRRDWRPGARAPSIIQMEVCAGSRACWTTRARSARTESTASFRWSARPGGSAGPGCPPRLRPARLLAAAPPRDTTLRPERSGDVTLARAPDGLS